MYIDLRVTDLQLECAKMKCTLILQWKIKIITELLQINYLSMQLSNQSGYSFNL